MMPRASPRRKRHLPEGGLPDWALRRSSPLLLVRGEIYIKEVLWKLLLPVSPPSRP